MRKFSGAMSAMAVSALCASHALAQQPTDEQQGERINFNIPAGPLAPALVTLSRQSNDVVMWDPALLKNKNAAAVKGEYTLPEALGLMLNSSGLKFRRSEDDEKAYFITAQYSGGSGNGGARSVVTRADVQVGARASDAETIAQNPATGFAAEDSDQESGWRDVIVVTGTSIRGVNPAASPVDVYSNAQIRRLGVTSVDQLLERIPQNLNSFTSNGAVANSASPNSEQRNAIDLRGLGPGSTLTLLNGRRLGPSGGSAIDVSLLPLGIIDRVEVLTDGASTIYGSDAVAGVVNFITIDEFDGAETSVQFSTINDSGREVGIIDQTVGANWDTGGILGSFSYFNASPLEGDDRDYVNFSPVYIAPNDVRYNGFLSGRQELSIRVNAFFDLLYSQRESKVVTARPSIPDIRNINAQSDQLFASAGLEISLTEQLSLDIVGSYVDTSLESRRNTFRTNQNLILPVDEDTDSSSWEATANLSGSLIEAPHGDIQFAIGAGYIRDKLSRRTLEGDSGVPDSDLDRDTVFAFGELQIPIVGPDADIPLLNRFEVNASARYTDIADVGDSLDPKIGVVWELTDDIRFRGTYSQSFRAPSLTELEGGSNFYFIAPVALFGGPDTFSDDNSSVYLLPFGDLNPDLQPESSENFTIGLDYTPSFVPGLSLKATYYDISYEDRIRQAAPGGTAAIFDPERFAPLFSTDVTADSVAAAIQNAEFILDFTGQIADPSDPSAIADVATVILDARVKNLASSDINGVDLSINYTNDLGGSQYRIGGVMSYIIDSTDQIIATSPEIEVVDTILNPVDLRFRTYVGASRNGFDGQLTFNYVDSYQNTVALGQNQIDSWFTVDATIAYEFDSDGFLKNGLNLTFGVQNLFNEDPPFVSAAGVATEGLLSEIGFDSANANPFGRILTFGLRKKW